MNLLPLEQDMIIEAHNSLIAIIIFNCIKNILNNMIITVLNLVLYWPSVPVKSTWRLCAHMFLI